MPRKPGSRHVSGQVLALGVKLLGVAALFWVMSLMLAKPLGAASAGFRMPVPYLLAVGALVTFLGWTLRPRGAAPAKGRTDPEWFPNSTDFARSIAEPMPSSLEQRVRTGRRPPAGSWNAQVFDDIEWRRFESLCGQLFAQAGFQPRSQSHGADGGVDIWLHSRNAEGPVAVVQCKHWHAKPVGVKEMREFFGVMASRKVARGTYATTSTFTEDARRFATENGIHLLDGAGLLALIATRTPEQQRALLDHAYEGEYWRPTCASCGIKMVERIPRKKEGQPFWGCADYPRCRFTLPMRSAA
ncbi:restriction endonuclease [Ramlibacter humi]|uniref:Restriction endonuclease n=1 Tax=Ramlibacter humi TaxID=2530451 RepID=A0A4Z0CEA2_9BURK|nr:restriction endonuclease [Ramlibacter humi]TFZ08900.1 restriction endonuclease [Ramlibacter humi]